MERRGEFWAVAASPGWGHSRWPPASYGRGSKRSTRWPRAEALRSELETGPESAGIPVLRGGVGQWGGARGSWGVGAGGRAQWPRADGDDDLRSERGRSRRPHPVRAPHLSSLILTAGPRLLLSFFTWGNGLKTAGIFRLVMGRPRISAQAVCFRICALDRYSLVSGPAFSDRPAPTCPHSGPHFNWVSFPREFRISVQHGLNVV